MTDKALAVANDLDELADLWPHLADALERDHAPGGGDKVAVSNGGNIGLPVNSDVLATVRTLGDEIPATARWAAGILGVDHNARRDVPGHLMHALLQYDRLNALGAAQEAGQLARKVRGWRDSVKAALGLKVPDRKLPQFCPVHDDPLVALVTPGDEGWIVPGGTGPTVTWRRTEVVLCRHCGTIWAPGQYALLGRLLRDADRRRVAEMQHAGKQYQTEGTAA
ncbi:hypothetical protein ACFP2T_13555 [Plantactinospora solaniradicis]|uniref:GATA-type domain-containing protein n=1 Tax=Plantactinospora solaniradicis TaxID=1723736 RepID=A0ABW1K885_9ACTN